MVQYIYFVKCPCCEDEHFDMFDDAKNYAMGCLSKKPVITQTEVCRNDFGECTDSNDLGQVWSWEDMMKDMPKEDDMTTFSKSETIDCDDDFFNCDFDNLDTVPDNYIRPERAVTPMVVEAYEGAYSTDFNDTEKVTKDMVATAVEAGKEVTIDLGDWEANPQEVRFSDGGVYSNSVIRAYKYGDTKYIFDIWHKSDDGDDEEGRDYYEEYTSFDELWETIADYVGERAVNTVTESRKPVPADMTIESLVEEMEENEDTVECKVCEELFEKASCHKDPEHGWVCEACGGKLTESDELTEVYHFTHLPRAENAKELIITIAAADPNAAPYLDDLNCCFKQPARARLIGGHFDGIGDVTDIEVVDDTIEVTLTSGNRSRQFELENLMMGGFYPNGLQRTCPAYRVLRAITAAAKQVSKDNAPTAAERGAQQVAAADAEVLAYLQNKPEVAEELRQHIVDIKFKVPPAENYSKLLDSGDPAFRNACRKLETLQTRFNNLPFADAARNAGLVVDREVTDTTQLSHIASSWNPACTIRFDTKLGELPNSMDAINSAKVDSAIRDGTERADLTNSYTADCFRLAVALITYFNNDVEFFRHTQAVESLTEEVLEEFDSAFTACPECGVEEAFDHESGFCTSCGFSIN